MAVLQKAAGAALALDCALGSDHHLNLPVRGTGGQDDGDDGVPDGGLSSTRTTCLGTCTVT